MKFIAPTWDEIYTKSIRLAGLIRKEATLPNCLIGVSRGGLVLARVLSDLLDIQRLYVIKCEYYSNMGETGRKPKITQKIQTSVVGKRVLIVDDVADSGKSLLEIKKYLQSKKPADLKLVTIYTKPWSKVLPDYYISKTSAWIIFPWELHESIKLLSARNLNTGLASTHIPKRYAKMLYKMDKNLKRI